MFSFALGVLLVEILCICSILFANKELLRISFTELALKRQFSVKLALGCTSNGKGRAYIVSAIKNPGYFRAPCVRIPSPMGPPAHPLGPVYTDLEQLYFD